MGIFDSIKNAIFGHATHAAPTGTATAGSAPAAARPSTPPPVASAPAAAPKPAAAPPAPSQPIDIEPVLDSLNAKSAQKLNWRTSIVDLMKLVGLDSSLQRRKELAKELGYTGNTDDSAAMNVWLHKEVMKKLAANGGKVPASLQ
jgi:3-oxoacyl-ACP reductase-like protein